jgi:four helix bundle protein
VSCYEDLDVYKKSMAAVKAVYDGCKKLPPEERYGLTGLELQRAAASVPANVAEGFIRRMPRDKARFYNVAEGSAEEVSVLIRIATTGGYAPPPAGLFPSVKDLAKMLRRLTDVTLARIGGR